MPPRRTVSNGVKADESTHVKDPFVYKVGTDEIELPSLSWIEAGFYRRTRHMTPDSQAWTLLEELLPTEQLKLVDAMMPAQLEAFFSAWREHSGISVGE